MPCLERGGTINQSEHHFFEGGIGLSEDGTELPVLEQGEQVGPGSSTGNSVPSSESADPAFEVVVLGLVVVPALQARRRVDVGAELEARSRVQGGNDAHPGHAPDDIIDGHRPCAMSSATRIRTIASAARSTPAATVGRRLAISPTRSPSCSEEDEDRLDVVGWSRCPARSGRARKKSNDKARP